MVNEKIQANKVKAVLTDNIGAFSRFAEQVIHDREFLNCAQALLPFDGVAEAEMKIAPHRAVVRKMGLIVMRMDMTKSLYALAVSLTTCIDEDEEDLAVFLTAGKTIDELQEYVRTDRFRRDVIEQCGNKATEHKPDRRRPIPQQQEACKDTSRQ